MSNKNPFEIRFDVLAMAKEMMDRTYDEQMNKMFTMLDTARENQASEGDLNAMYEKYMPKMYRPDEVMAKAEELYKFILKKD